MNKGIFGLVAVFVVSAAVGYFAFPLFGIGQEAGNEDMVATKEEEKAVEEKPVLPELSLIGSPSFIESSKTYEVGLELKHGATNIYLLESKKKEVVKSQSISDETGVCYFPVDPVADGIYYAYVINKAGYSSDTIKIEGCKIREMAISNPITKSELDSLINAKDVTAAKNAIKGRTVGEVDYSFPGAKADDHPAHLIDIINLLAMKTWSSATVIDVRYDENKRLKWASISVTYPVDTVSVTYPVDTDE